MYVPCLIQITLVWSISDEYKKKFYNIDTCSPSAFITPEMEEKSVKIGGLYY